MAVVFEKPKALTDAVFHYCPGCTHGIIHRSSPRRSTRSASRAGRSALRRSAVPYWPMTTLPVTWSRRRMDVRPQSRRV